MYLCALFFSLVLAWVYLFCDVVLILYRYFLLVVKGSYAACVLYQFHILFLVCTQVCKFLYQYPFPTSMAALFTLVSVPNLCLLCTCTFLMASLAVLFEYLFYSIGLSAHSKNGCFLLWKCIQNAKFIGNLDSPTWGEMVCNRLIPDVYCCTHEQWDKHIFFSVFFYLVLMFPTYPL